MLTRKITAGFLALMMAIALLPAGALAEGAELAGVSTNGSCGNSMYWTLDTTTGALSITGTGMMWDWDFDAREYTPWLAQSEQIKTISIQAGVNSIGDFAFAYCRNLQSVDIPNSVSSIGQFSLLYCSVLEEIMLPQSLISIGKRAFAGCSNLCDITVPRSVNAIGACAFLDCTALVAINVAAENERYASEDGVLFDKQMTNLLQYPANRSESTYMIPNSVTAIGEHAFEACAYLQSVSIPSSVISIRDAAFKSCNSLRSVVIPDSVTTIGGSAFHNCGNLARVTISKSVAVISAYAFSGCAMDSITIPASVVSIEQEAFSECQDLHSITMADSVRSIGSLALSGCTCLNSISIPGSVTTIETRTFSGCSNLHDVKILGAVTSIGFNAFSDCSSLKTIILPSSVNSIGNEAFSGCTWLEAYFCGNAPDVTDERFAGAAFTSTATLHFISGKVGWTNLTWRGYKTMIWNPAPSHAPTLALSSATHDGISLAWETIPEATNYSIYRGISAEDINWYADTDDIGFVDANAEAGNTYYYQVTANKSIGIDTFSGPRSAIVSATIRAPEIPTPALTLACTQINNVGMTWTAVSEATGYTVYRGTSMDNLSQYAETANPWYSDAGATAGATYYYKVKAYKSVGGSTTYSSFSNTVTAVVPAMPVLTAPRLTLARSLVNNVGITWAAVPGATGYGIYKGSGGALNWYAQTANPWFTDSRAANGSTNTYQVLAYCSSGTSAVYGPRSNIIMAAIGSAALSAPILNLAYAQPNHTGLTWNAIPGATGYSIYRGMPNAAIDWYAESANPWFIDSASRPSTTYTYQVMAFCRGDGESTYGAKSAVKAATIPAIATPAVNVARTTPGNIGITWNGITGATGYSIYRGTDPIILNWYAGTTNPWYSDRNTAAGVTYYYQVLTYLQTPEGNWYSAKSPVKIVTAR